MASARAAGLFVGIMLLALPGVVHAVCDVAGADAAALSAARDAIDAACPCAAAATRGLYRRCANDVVKARILTGDLTTTCRREALRHAKQSICGRPGRVVCCRTRGDGRTRHRIAPGAAACLPTSQYTACVSSWQSIPTGCTDTGCVPNAVCGNALVEAGETCDPPDGTSCDASCHTIPPAVCGDSIVEGDEGCDPPDYLTCDATCQPITCEPPPTTCGNGTVDAGEACEPPGIEACGRDCQLAPCAAPHAGEIGVACVEGGTNVAAAGKPGGYLLTWGGWHAVATPQMLARRVDADGIPTDPAPTVLSDGAPCGSFHVAPSVASDGSDYFALWSAGGGFPPPYEGGFFEAMYGRQVGGTAGVGTLDQFAYLVPFGTCRSDIFGPTMAAGVGPSRFALGWNTGASCTGFLIYQDPSGFILDLGPPRTTTGASLGVGPPTGGFPVAGSSSAASVGSLGGDTLWAWHAAYQLSASSPIVYFVASSWTGPGGNTSPMILSARASTIVGRPRVAAGTASLLATWAESSIPSSGAHDIRALRATRASGNIDPDGGLLIATTTGAVFGGPDVAFDGNRWFVVWAEASGATNDLRAVAVEQDGTVVDATPRLVATDVVSAEASAASAGDGRVLVLFARSDGDRRAVRATLVVP